MKKIIGFLGVAVFAATMFFSTNAVNGSNSDISFDGLTNMNVANAQSEFNSRYQITGVGVAKNLKCDLWVDDPDAPLIYHPGYQMWVPAQKKIEGNEIDCEGWTLNTCWSQACH